MPNPLLRETLEYIENHPEEWDQEEYLCRTGMCFFGHALLLSGKVRIKPKSFWFEWKTGERLGDIMHETSALLGISEDEGKRLASSSNKLSDLRSLVEEFENA
jgi:hypothetical protein